MISSLRKITAFFFILWLAACKQPGPTASNQQTTFSTLLKNYYEQSLKLYPLEATQNGDNRYNDLLPNNLTVAFRNQEHQFYQSYSDSLGQFDRSKLDSTDQMNYDVLQWETQINLERLKFHEELMPINQFWSLSITMGQLGSGSFTQPFKTVKDYDNFLSRVSAFTVWCDTAIANMRRGMTQGYVLPKVLAERVQPQLQAMIVTDATQSLFYTPIKNMPTDFSDADKKRLTDAYSKAITEEIIPSYQKLYDFFVKEYTPACRDAAGISAIPNGKDYYNFLIKEWTTTDLTADSIFNLGMKEVNRIQGQMEQIKDRVGYKGDLKSFLNFLRTDKQFFPFKTDSDVIQRFRNIYTTEKPQVDKLFTTQPKSRFEIRETEKFRAASASAEYQQGTPDGSRPGIFYVPIVDATKYNDVSMESLFLHEAIPGHHFQVSLQQENKELPDFRRFIWYGAFGEGWALYCESLGDSLGLYTDPYQKLGNLSEEMHRAIRLVVDVGIHTKGWTREQAIQFSLEHEAEPEADITSEIERYMAIPGQALSYKIGQLNILQLRAQAQQQLGGKFNWGNFHEQMLKNGCLPLSVLDADFNQWLGKQKGS
ncbi:MAG: DUF885 domain-containing protein [Chitinophagales bacterium]